MIKNACLRPLCTACLRDGKQCNFAGTQCYFEGTLLTVAKASNLPSRRCPVYRLKASSVPSKRSMLPPAVIKN